MFKFGEVVFFREARRGTKRASPGAKFKGHGFAVLLGHVAPFQKEPTKLEILRCLGAIGFLSLDDVGDFLGDEAGAACLKKFQEKYYPPVILGADGKPMPEPEPERPPGVPEEPPTEVEEAPVKATPPCSLKSPGGEGPLPM